MGDRPSDAMQPNTKRRAGAQITKDDAEEEEDDQVEDPGEWKPTAVVEGRRKVKVRRQGEPAEPAPQAAAPATGAAAEAGAKDAAPAQPANPFAGVSLTAPSANPFAGFNLVPPSAAAKPEVADDKKENLESKAAGQGEPVKADKDASTAAATAAPAAAPAAAAGGFGGLAATGKPFGGFSGATGGFGSVTGAAFGSAGTSNSGGVSTAPAFTFGTGAFPNIGAAPLKAGVPALGNSGAAKSEEDGEAGGGEALQVFNSTAEFQPVVQLAEQAVVTGEEGETTALSADGALFEFDAANRKWRERGKGEFRINTNKGQARMVMRQSGNLRLLLNAVVYRGMPVTIMAGDSGVTFACINFAAAEAAEKDKEASKPPIATWGVRIKSQEKVKEVSQMLMDLAKAAADTGAGAEAKDVEAGTA